MLPPTAHLTTRTAAVEWLAHRLEWERILGTLRSGHDGELDAA